MLAAAIGLAAPAAAREFRVTDTQAEDYPTVQALAFMARLVEQRTQGRHRIHIFHSRQLGEEKETIEQTRAGAIDLNRTNVAPIGALIPAADAVNSESDTSGTALTTSSISAEDSFAGEPESRHVRRKT